MAFLHYNDYNVSNSAGGYGGEKMALREDEGLSPARDGESFSDRSAALSDGRQWRLSEVDVELLREANLSRDQKARDEQVFACFTTMNSFDLRRLVDFFGNSDEEIHESLRRLEYDHKVTSFDDNGTTRWRMDLDEVMKRQRRLSQRVAVFLAAGGLIWALWYLFFRA
jgi:hypothetical protein